MTGAVLVLVCKRPSLGIGKQRLSAHLSPQGALQVAYALLECALEDLQDWPGPVVISPARPEDRSWAESLIKGVRVIPQGKGNLGQRINTLDQKLRGEGYARIVYMGSDAPALEKRDFKEVRKALGHHDVVLSPATDGGVVLMASRLPWPDLSILPWSTECLGTMLRNACRSTGMDVILLSEGFDIDHAEDLERAISALEKDPRSSRQALRNLACQLLETPSPHLPPGDDLWNHRH